MSAITFLNFIAATGGFAAAMFFCKGTVSLSNRAVFDLAGTYWKFNRSLADALVSQRAEYVAGAILLVISFAAQLAANLIPGDSQSPLFCSVPWAVASLAIAILVLVALALMLRAALIRRSQRDIARLLSDTIGGIMPDAPLE